MSITVRPIGVMRSVFHYKNGTPRQSSLCENARGILTIEKSVFNNAEHSLEGLEQYSHAWVIFIFHKNNNPHTKAKVKPPRLDGQRVGVFSSRSPYRPNNIGLSLVQIDKIEGASVYLSGIDILDGTPILDIKPYIPDYDKPKESTSVPVPECPDASPVTEPQKHTLLSRNDTEVIDSIDSSDSGRNSGCSCDTLQCLSQSGDTQDNSSGHSISWSQKIISDTGKNSAMTREGASNQRTKGLEQSHHSDSERISQVSASQHPVAEGFYALSAALEKAGHSLKSGRNEPTESADEVTSTVKDAASAMDKKDIFEQDIDDGDDDVDMLVGDILNKAALDLTSLAQTSSAVPISTSVQRKPMKSDKMSTKSKSGNEDVAKKSETITSSKKAEKIKSSTDNTSSKTSSPKSRKDGLEPVLVAQWLSKPPVSKLNVTFTSEAYSQLQKFSKNSTDPNFQLQMFSDFEEAEKAVRDILHEEPRSVYRRQHCQDSLYYFTVDVLHVTCWFDEDTAQIVRVKPAALVPKLQQPSSPRDVP